MPSSCLKRIIKKAIFPNTYSSEAYITYLKKCGVDIGNHCYVWSPNHTLIDTQRPEMLHIGDYCKITQGVIILSHDYSVSVAKRVYHEHIGNCAATTIGNNVFIGMNAIILMGSKIGDNCIVGAGAVVSGMFPSNTVIAGNPAKVICSIEDFYNKHKAKEISEAKSYYLEFKRKHNRRPQIEEMGNAFAWLYLPRTQESVEQYRPFFRLSGDNEAETIEDFLKSKPYFSGYEAFCNLAEEGKNEIISSREDYTTYLACDAKTLGFESSKPKWGE